jgi:hypothetical protein
MNLTQMLYGGLVMGSLVMANSFKEFGIDCKTIECPCCIDVLNCFNN